MSVDEPTEPGLPRASARRVFVLEQHLIRLSDQVRYMRGELRLLLRMTIVFVVCLVVIGFLRLWR